MRNSSADCADNAAALPEQERRIAFNFPSLRRFVARMERSAIRESPSACETVPDFDSLHPGYHPFIIARRASARPISTKADVTSGPPTKIRVGVFILFHS